MNETTDGELLESYVKDGSEPAFAALVERYIDFVYSAAARMVVDPHLAEDVTQAVFTALARNASKLERPPSLAGWLHATARNQAAMIVRGEVRRKNREREAVCMNEDAGGSKSPWEELAPELDAALGQLNEHDRDVLLLRFFRSKSAREIGGQLKLSEEAAQKRVTRALERLRSLLVRRGITSGITALATLLGAHAVTAAPAGLGASVLGPALKAGTSIQAATATSKISGIVFAMMTAKKWIAASVATVIAVVLAPRMFKESAPKPEISVRFDAPVRQPQPAAAEPPGPGFNWARIESGDYREFIANLRASGAPERLVRDAVTLELYRGYMPRIREIQRPNRTNKPYWQRSEEIPPTEAQKKAVAAIVRELRAVLTNLLGPEAKTQDALSVLYAQPDFDAIRLAWLPADVEARASAILEPILEEERANDHRMDWPETRELLDRRVEALRSLLTPKQLEEYRLREDQYAQHVRVMTRHADLTPEEFAALVKANDSGLFNPVMTPASQQAQEQKFSKLFGPARAAELIKMVDLSYGGAEEAAERYGLASDAPDRAWRLKREALAEHARLLKDASLSSEARRQRENELVERTQTALIELLGREGFQLFQNRDSLWLGSLRSQ